MTQEKVSIIIPTYNPGKILVKALESVITQDYSNTELIVMDGGSTDGTVSLLQQYNIHIAYWKSEPDSGIYDAMNIGIAKATGTWLLFLGADDELMPGILSSVFDKNNFSYLAIVYGKVCIKNSRKELGHLTSYDQLIETNIPHQGIFYHKSVFQKLGSYDIRFKILADYDLNLKIFQDETLKKTFINKVISSFGERGISNRTIDYNFFEEKKEYFINAKNLSGKDKRIAKYFFFIGIVLVLKKHYRKGWYSIFHSIIFSKNPFYFSLLLFDFVLSKTGLRGKYKYV